MNTPAPVQTLDLAARFPGTVHPDTRPGYSGWVVENAALLETATALRDEFGFDYLSSLTAVDYLPDGKMEVVYQVYKTTGGVRVDFQSAGSASRPDRSGLAGIHLPRG